MEKEYTEHQKLLIKKVLDHFDKEDSSVRERQIRIWRQLKYYWVGLTRHYWSETAHNWKIWDGDIAEDNYDQDAYDKPVNVFKAYLESIIAALSISIPSIICTPDDADDPMDIATAKAGSKIYELVSRYNNVQFLWLHALYIYCTEGMIACYSYSKEEEAYGTYETKEYKEDSEDKYICPNCGDELPDEIMHQDVSDIADDSVNEGIGPTLNQQPITCPECGYPLDGLEKQSIKTTKLIGITKNPKTRQCMEVYGGLYVKVPNYAMTQADCPYLDFDYETHYSYVRDKYDHLKDVKFDTGSGGTEQYGRWGRLSTQYNGEFPTNTVTIRNWWFRPSSFSVLDKDEADELKKLFPTGCKAIFINDQFAEACEESMDSCWTLTHNPLSDYIHYDPLGLLLTSVQDITNDLISLTLQTIEHGIPQTFVAPDIVNLDEYRQTEAIPGGIYPTKPVAANKNIAEGFTTLKTATLGAEVLPFAQRVQDMGQLVSGALPSLFGGQAAAGSKTASEYAMSRSQALQRLQTPWKMLSFWWKDVFAKVIQSYIEDAVDDDRFVKRDANGNFINIFIRKAELEGKIGEIELEAAENLPVTWQQKKDIILELLQLQNPIIMEALMSPENLPFIQEAIGLTDFVIPGEDDRTKQYEEIQQLLQSQPIPSIGEDGITPVELPSVEVDPLLDNHQIEAAICRNYLISDSGRLAKRENPEGYKNVLLHMKMHISMMPPPPLPTDTNADSNGKVTENKNKSAQPIGEENDSQLPIQ